MSAITRKRRKAYICQHWKNSIYKMPEDVILELCYSLIFLIFLFCCSYYFLFFFSSNVLQVAEHCRMMLRGYIDWVCYLFPWMRAYTLHPCICLVEHKVTGCAPLQTLLGILLYPIYEVWLVQRKSMWKCKKKCTFPIIIFLKQCCIGKNLAILHDCILCGGKNKGFAVGGPC